MNLKLKMSFFKFAVVIGSFLLQLNNLASKSSAAVDESGVFLLLDSGKMYTLGDQRRFEYIRSSFKITQVNSSHCFSNSTIGLTSIFLGIGDSVGLECPRCGDKQQQNATKKTVWYKSNLKDRYVEISPGEQNRFFVDQDTLLIKHFQLGDSNSYFCGGNPFFRFNLLAKDEQISNRPILVSKNRSLEALKGVRFNFSGVAGERHDHKSGLTVFSEWSDWSECEDCDTTSIRKRAGHCKVKYEPSKEVPLDKFLLHMNRSFFPFGWPCNLSLSYGFFSSEAFLESTNLFSDYVEYENCNESCIAFNSREKNKVVS
jgi:hypothetical protein